MAQNVTQKLIARHLLSGQMEPGEEIALKIDQTLTQDATGTLALLEFEAIGIPRVRNRDLGSICRSQSLAGRFGRHLSRAISCAFRILKLNCSTATRWK
jgi:homoaconitase/3-isopropylmalate dehydratase large subunit